MSSGSGSDLGPRVRLDKWLWAARFFKTRSLASEAISGGKVHVNTQRVKPARTVQLGDRLEIRRGPYTYTVEVTGLSDRRGPATQAALLYRETEASITQREALAAQRRLLAAAQPNHPERRPNKKDRRHIIRFRRQQDDE